MSGTAEFSHGNQDFGVETHSLKANPEAWKNFQNLPESYKRIRIAFIDHYRRRDERYFQRALRHFIEMTAKNKRFGYVKEMA